MTNVFVDKLSELLQEAHERKTDTTDAQTNTRRWAIVYTDLEKIKAYVSYFLVEEEDSEG